MGLDWLLRASLLREFTHEAAVQYVQRAAAVAVAWALLWCAAIGSRRLGGLVVRVTMAFALALFVGAQVHTALRYGTYLNERVIRMGTSMVPRIAFDAWLPGILLASGPLWASVRAARDTRARPLLSAVAFVSSIVLFGAIGLKGAPTAGWDNGGPPDVLYLRAVAARIDSAITKDDIMTQLPHLPDARTSAFVPVVEAPRRRGFNVVMFVNESVRSSDACSSYTPNCTSMPELNATLPARFGLRELRAVDSTTALSLPVLWSGVHPASSRNDLLSTPLLWEYARAIGYKTGYFTAHNMLFANFGRWLESVPLDVTANGTQIEPYASYQAGANDALVMKRALDAIMTFDGPFFVVIHFSNTHFPYWIDDKKKPFTDQLQRDEPDGGSEADTQLARYRDAILRQDHAVAEFVRKLRATDQGQRTAFVYASDHGEQIYERGQLGHTWSLYEEEIHVPFFIDTPPGMLTEDEVIELRKLESLPRTMLDVAPTVLELLAEGNPFPESQRWMKGTSLLRGGTSQNVAVVLTNCSDLFSCATRNWGAMRYPFKLFSTEDETGGWRCFNVQSDPEERHLLPLADCGDLRGIAEAGRGTPFR